MNTTLNIGLAGLGTVGGGLVRLLSENAEEIRARSGCDFNLKAVAVRNPNRKRDLPEGVRLTTDPMTLADDPDIDVVIELMGGIDTAKELITRSLAKGKQVVTANKALLAEEGESLFRLADEKGATLLYEASVAGGIPIVQTLKESLTGNHITSLEGILNGTGNYILSEMTSKGVNFAPALAEAQEKGYAEADPTLDIDGFDTAHKLVLLIRLAWGVDYPYTKMPIEGIRNLDKMDIDFAREFGYRIKLLGRARMRNGKLEAGVFPTLVNHTYLLARVGGAYNAVRVEGNAVGSLFLHGLGAGSLPTASAVLGDLISIARQNNKLNSGFVKQVLPQADILPPEEACSTYYMRFMVKDDPGVLRDLSGALSDQGVSIAQAIQKGQSEAGVPLVFMTHEAPVSAIRKAVETMRKSDFLLAPAICYRVMG
ncbi:homoserine dehydrogenase [Bilophila wadsworthia]|uniref:homoserine dehydrogenase n=1 Tax=Bilophila wadsworthia TaxID=35833 RepID=UPI00266DC07F|nr:homoserine dehydrogenase [Bilophila wadsworthia]